MSFNQSRSDKNDSSQYRKSGRSASFHHPRGSSGGYGKGGAPAPSPSPSSSSSSAANQSFKKPGNAQGAQPRVSFPPANHHPESSNAPSAPPNSVHNGATAQTQARGSSNAPATGTTSKPAETTPAPPRGIQTLPKAPTSRPTSMSSDTTAPTTPVKAPGDQSKGFAFQFGSISPGFVNGMQVPPRTSSAPPKIDEQKRDQARNDAVKAVPSVPIPPSRQQLPRKDLGSANHSSTADVHSTPKTKTQAQPVNPATQAHKSQVHQVPRMSMPMTYHQPQVPVKFSTPNPQIQSQGIPPASIPLQMQIPMPLPVANAPPQVQQQMFVPGLQPHQLPPQGTLHQSQGLSFSQLSPQLGNLGMGIGQYTQQQGGQFGGPRKTSVKITHPDTHQEVRLDKPSDAFSDGGPSGRSHPNVPPHSQPIVSYPPGHQFNYYPNYNPSTLFFPGSGSLPVSGAQINPVSQAPRFNYAVNQGPQNVSFMNPQANNLLNSARTAVSKQGTVEQSRQEHAQNSRDGTSSTSSVAREAVKQADGSINWNAAGVSSLRNSTAAVKIEPPKVSGPSGESSAKESEVGPGSSPKPGTVREPSFDSLSVMTKSNSAGVSAVSRGSAETSTSSTDCLPHEVSAPAQVPAPAENNAEAGRRENYGRSNSMKDLAKKQSKADDVPQPRVEEQAPIISSLLSHATVPSDIVNDEAGAQEDSRSETTGGTLESRSDSRTGADATSSTESRIDSMENGSGSSASEISNAAITVKAADPGSQRDDGLDGKTTKEEDERSIEHVDGAKGSSGNSGYDSESSLVKSSEVKEREQESISKVETSVESSSEVVNRKSDLDEEVTGKVDSEISTSTTEDGTATESVPCTVVLSAGSLSNDVSSLCAPESGDGSTVNEEVTGSIDISAPEPQEKARTNDDVREKSAGKGGSLQISSSNDKPVPELNRSKSTTAKGKKKKKELLRKADAAGSTLDLYMAYKGPEEKKETMMSSGSAEIALPSTDLKSELADACQAEAVVSEDGDESKAEPDDWEDAADISTPKLESTANGKPVDNQEGDGCTAKKYSRDFLLKFADQYTSLPEAFEVTSDIAEVFTYGVTISRSVGRDHHPSPGRPSNGPRLDRRGSNVRDDDRWTKVPGPFAGHDLRLDVGFSGNAGFRSGQGANYGVLRNPRAQSPIQYPILPGPMQPPVSQGGMQRTGSDADRWQRATSFQQKGLIPSPQTPLQMMHKAEKKYEVGKVTDEEQAKQRQLKAILNKLTPQNFEKLFGKVLAVQIDNAVTLTGLMSQIFDKALMEPTFCEMYADLCFHLSQDLPDFNEGDEKTTFKRLLLNKCQEEFERGEREQEEANKIEEEGEVKQTEEEREEKRIKARRRMLGNIRLIGELFKKKMLTERIMHECVKKLLGQYQTQIPDEEDLEALCKLMSTIGEMIDQPKAKSYMDAYFDKMTVLSKNMTLSSRVRFMLKDAIDLRKNKWQQRRKVEGPKKIEEVHRDAAQERHAQAGRVARSPGISTSGRRGQQMEFAPRGNPLSSPNVRMGSFRGLQSTRGYGAQDARFEERQAHEPRPLSVPLSQRSMGDDAITLGPQGGLGRGLSVRGQSSLLGTSSSDVSSGAIDSRRTPVGLNGFSSIDRTNSYSSREDSMMRSGTDRYTGPALTDQLSVQGGRNVRSPRYGSDRPSTAPLSSRGNGPALTQSAPAEKVRPEEKLRDMSIAAIREYYSAKDEKEVALCIQDLNSPSFYPSMVSLWVADSFERKDLERDLLTKLLINLSKPQDRILSHGQLIEGFESVLTTLEDAVNDAPKATEFLGRIFGKLIAENVVSLSEIGRILYEGGGEQSQLLEAGLAADVLGSTLEVIQSEKGEVALNGIRRSSNLRLEDFRPPGSIRSRKLEKFI
ncbi:hypothetical protein CDL15_Pgr004123 [Punica granatum]|uniref:Eukaryotic translation initiation factor 4G n=1 Tax=Punica granatum TaxID=22663 RepID=A0A218XFJ4_PUNGR|nr:hypothetical protein CDL15_Pgr004123 [Punica granatum]